MSLKRVEVLRRALPHARSTAAFARLFAAALFAACGRSDVEGWATDSCVPGTQVACPCPGGRSGAQVCREDGALFLACECQSHVETSGGASSVGGTSGTNGGAAPGAGGSPGGTAHGGETHGGTTSGATTGGTMGGAIQGDCPTGRVLCGNECVDVNTSVRHCGACDVACADELVCVERVCQAACQPDETLCGDSCVPLASDPKNCGECGVACRGQEACLGGTCDCRVGWTRCGDACVDAMTDAEHCGECNAACDEGAHCVHGSCSKLDQLWPTLGFDMHRTGFNPESEGPPARLAWAETVIDAALNPVVLERGRVVVSGLPRFAGTGPVRALWAHDGTEIWTHDFGNVESVGQPTLVDGRVYIQHQQGLDLPEKPSLYCLDAASGDVIWNTDFNAQWEHYWSPAVSDSMVYVDGGEFGGLYGFDRTDGRRVFFNDDLEQYDEWSPTLVDDGVLTMIEGNLRQHHPTSGTIDWTASFPWDWRGWSMKTVVPVRGGVAYVIAPPTLYAVRLADREILWQQTSAFRSYPAVSDDHVYALDGQSLVAYARDSGEAVFSVELDAGSAYPPVVTAGHVWVADSDSVRAIEIPTGKEVWRDDRGGGWLSIGGNLLFVAGADGVLSAYELGATEDAP